MTLGTPPLVHRKLCRDEDEAGPCFFCGAFIHKGDRYVMIVTRCDPPEHMGLGVCFTCAKRIGDTVPKEWDGGGDSGGGRDASGDL